MEQKVRKGSENRLEGKDLPKGYNIDTIVIMPVNADMSFVYWEITDKLLNGTSRELDVNSAEPTIKIFERDSRKEICSFEVKDMIGKKYIRYPASFKPLVAEFGILEGGKFTGFLRSKTALVPSLETSRTGDEVWMEKAEGLGVTVRISESEGTRDISSSGILARAALRSYYEETGAGPGVSASSEILRTEKS